MRMHTSRVHRISFFRRSFECTHIKVQECCRLCQNENIFGRELHKENVPCLRILACMFVRKTPSTIIIVRKYV